MQASPGSWWQANGSYSASNLTLPWHTLNYTGMWNGSNHSSGTMVSVHIFPSDIQSTYLGKSRQEYDGCKMHVRYDKSIAVITAKFGKLRQRNKVLVAVRSLDRRNPA
jgi:hypothetical protein